MPTPVLPWLSAALLIWTLSDACRAGEVADVIQAKSGYMVSEKVEQVIARLPAPKIQAQGACNASALGFENGAEWASGWNKAGYTNYLLMWGIYHFGDRVGSRKPPFCQDLQFIGQAWQSALGAKPSGKLSEADLQAFIRLADGGDTRLAITRERADKPVVENGQVVPPEELLARNREASDLDYGRIRWKQCALNMTAYVTIARCTLDIPDKELTPARSGPAPDPRRRVKADAAPFKLGSDFGKVLKQLPPALCDTHEEDGDTVIACRKRPTEDEYCQAQSKAIDKIRNMVHSIAEVPPGIPLSSDFIERLQKGTGTLRRLIPELDFCKAQYQVSAEKDSDIIFNRHTLTQMDLHFNGQRLNVISVIPEDSQSFYRWIIRQYGENTSYIQQDTMIRETDATGFTLTRPGPSFIETMYWDIGSMRIRTHKSWFSFCSFKCR